MGVYRRGLINLGGAVYRAISGSELEALTATVERRLLYSQSTLLSNSYSPRLSFLKNLNGGVCMGTPVRRCSYTSKALQQICVDEPSSWRELPEKSLKTEKTVEDVMPIATGLEREELEYKFQGKKWFDLDPPVRPFGTKWQWSSSGKMPVLSHPQSSFLSQKLSSYSSVTLPDLSQKEPITDSPLEGSVVDKEDEAVEPASSKQGEAEAKETQQVKNSVSEEKATQRRLRPEPQVSKIESSESEAKSDSREEKELSTEDLIQLVQEKEELLKSKHKEIQLMQDKILRSYADVENVMDRTRRDAENAKKFAIQNFAQSLLDVADNLSRASSVVKESFRKLATKDSNGAAALLKTLLEGVDMTEKQLLDVFKKYGVEKFDPLNEDFDPHRHMAVFEVQDPNKSAGTVGVVLKAGYTLHDRVIRPAEVGVVKAADSEAARGFGAVDS